MKKLLIIPFFFFSLSVFGQFTKPELYNGINLNIRNKGASQKRLADMLDSIVVSMGTGNLTGAVTSSGLATSLGSFTSNALGTAISDPVRTVTGTDAIVQADNGRTIYFNSGSPFNFTIDALTINSFALFRNIGSATVTFVDGSGVTSSGGTSLAAGEKGAIEYQTGTTPIIDVAGSGGGGDMILANVQTSTGKKTFQSDATNAGINVGTAGSDPSSLTTGDFWVETGNSIKVRNNATSTYLMSVTAAPNTGYIPFGTNTNLYTQSSALVFNSGTGNLSATQFNGVALITGGTATKYLSEDGTYTTPSGGGGLTYSQVKAISMKIR